MNVPIEKIVAISDACKRMGKMEALAKRHSRLGRKVKALCVLVAAEVKAVNDRRDELIKAHGTEVEGKPGTYTFTAEAMATINKEMQDLLADTAEVPERIDWTCDEEFPLIEDQIALDPFIKFPED